MCVGCYGKDEREYGRNKTRTTENEEGATAVGYFVGIQYR
jgi:hypothetical protein